MSSFHLRRATHADLEALCALELAAFGPGPSLAPYGIAQALSLFPATCWLAEDDAGALGFVLAGAGESAWILDVAVHPRAQGRGIGRALVAVALQHLAPATPVFATVSPGNAASRALLTRAGFVEDHLFPGYFGPGEDRLVVVWNRP